MNKRTHEQIVKDHLLENGSITSWEAIEDYRITRLSAVIYNLVHKHEMNIKSEMIYQHNMAGDLVKFSRYTLVKEDE